MEEFGRKQVATCVPPESIEDVSVTMLDDGNLFVQIGDEYWIGINLADKTFAVGVYEG